MEYIHALKIRYIPCLHYNFFPCSLNLYILGKPAGSNANLGDPGTKDGSIGLTAAFGACTILTIIMFIAYVQYKRRHQ